MSTTINLNVSDGPEDVLRRRPSAFQTSLETRPIVSSTLPTGIIPNTPLAASTISFLLGSLCSLGFVLFLGGGSNYRWFTSQLGFFLVAWSCFHWGEFAVTAGWNREKCSVDSFLLENGWTYHAAHLVALAEYWITLWLKPSWKSFPYVSTIGIILVLLSQLLRSVAMIHAAESFSHAVAWQKRENHTLVTTGVYAWFRHPSYTGFFYWALGMQFVLQNPICFVAYIVVLWRFFNQRITYEERGLVRFFGQDYVAYRARVGTKIPFIP